MPARKPLASFQGLGTGYDGSIGSDVGRPLVGLAGLESKKAAPPPPMPPRSVSNNNGLAPGRIPPLAGSSSDSLASGMGEKPKATTRKPAVPAKPKVLAAANKSQPTDLLGDDSSVEVSGWEALKPS